MCCWRHSYCMCSCLINVLMGSMWSFYQDKNYKSRQILYTGPSSLTMHFPTTAGSDTARLREIHTPFIQLDHRLRHHGFQLVSLVFLDGVFLHCVWLFWVVTAMETSLHSSLSEVVEIQLCNVHYYRSCLRLCLMSSLFHLELLWSNNLHHHRQHSAKQPLRFASQHLWKSRGWLKMRSLNSE